MRAAESSTGPGSARVSYAHTHRSRTEASATFMIASNRIHSRHDAGSAPKSTSPTSRTPRAPASSPARTILRNAATAHAGRV
nr:hypothetical protein GCM10020093_018230 [Planobispora longispora]